MHVSLKQGPPLNSNTLIIRSLLIELSPQRQTIHCKTMKLESTKQHSTYQFDIMACASLWDSTYPQVPIDFQSCT